MKIRILGTFIAVTLSLFGFAQGDIQNISAEEFNTQIEKNPGIILDVRTPAETAQGYIPDASFIDLYDPEFKAKVKLMQKNWIGKSKGLSFRFSIDQLDETRRLLDQEIVKKDVESSDDL